MSGFALLQVDVEDASDLAPAKPVVAEPEPAAPPAAPTTPEPRNISFAERGSRGWRDDFGGRGRRGGRGGRGRGRGRGRGGRGGRGAFTGGGPGSWDVRNSGPDGQQRSFQRVDDAEPPAETAPVEHRNEEEKSEEGAGEGDKDDKNVQPPKEKEMTLDEYMAKKAAMQLGMRSLSTKATRKANDGRVGVGGKMAVLKKKADADHEVDETSIMSAVHMKPIVETRNVKDSTHAAVADNAKNQEFFKTPARTPGARGYQSRDSRMNGNGDFRRGGDRFRGGYRGGRYEGGDNRYRSSAYNRDNDQYRDSGDNHDRQTAGAPNVDDQAAFPSLNA